MKRLLVVVMMAVCLRGWAQAPAVAPSGGPLAQKIQTMVHEPAVARAHWGVMVTAMDGSPILAMNEAQMFRPASNAKLFTTAAALALLGPGSTFETKVYTEGTVSEGVLKGDLVLQGDGDANLSGRRVPYVSDGAKPTKDEPKVDPLHVFDELAAQVAAAGVKKIDGDVVGDDTLFPWEPYAEDWVIDDMVWGYGAPVSAISVDDNQLRLTIAPGVLPKDAAAHAVGRPTSAIVNVEPGLAYYAIDNEIVTTEARSKTSIGIDRAIGSKTLRLYGTIAEDAGPDVEEIAIADPAEYAAMALASRLAAHGVALKGKALARHLASEDAESFLEETHRPMAGLDGGSQSGISPCLRCKVTRNTGEKELAAHRSATVAEDVVVTNKVSQNLHAELLLHQLSVAFSDDPRAGSTAQGVRVVRQYLLNAGVDKDDFVFVDGSGLSGHDLVAPRAIARLLQFASRQPWFPQYKASLPVGGVDGSLSHRFAEPPMKGHVFAKTGSLGESRALSGYLECASGRTVIFSVMVDNHLPGSNADREVMDRIVAAIAAAE
jgi:D-alanyl-D-alanine carboxypeptidase/D-alanyl-D-alanine-endopeptidase (penicillin-binding protein 4)